MKLHLPKKLLCAMMAVFCPISSYAVWMENNSNYYICDYGGVWDAEGMTEVNKDVYEISAKDAHIEIRAEYEWDGRVSPAIMDGDVILDGRGSSFGSGEQLWNFERIYSTYYNACVGFYKHDTDEYAQWHISGSLTIKSDTAVFFWNEVPDSYDYDQEIMEVRKCSYDMPDTSQYIIRCASVDEQSVSKLKPYLIRWDYTENYMTEVLTGGAWGKYMDGYSFYAITGEGGYSYIYLGQGGAPAIPPNSIVVGNGQNVLLGQTSDTIPSKDKPVYLQGGVVDASSLDDSLLNNQIFQGSSGSVLTDVLQTMTLDGTDLIKYSILRAGGATSAADFEIGKAGVQSNIELNGEKYESSQVNVNGGTLTIGSKTTVGLGDALSSITVADKAALTNYGTIAADVTGGIESKLLNSGRIAGDVQLGENGILTNNGTITGGVTAYGKVYGSGSFNSTTLMSGSLLHVGNSPGYQYHEALVIDRGATLSFTVDGLTAASLSSAGAGTHSFLKADSLTINSGSETVTVDIEVTMGIVAAGRNPITLTLLDAGSSNAQSSDFTLNLKDEAGLLETGSSLEFEDGKLTLNAAISKAALAALMDSNSANVANTMWSSANMVHEFARTAENQFLIGTPGQTSFWWAGMGSFMSVGGTRGFTSDAGGYAVGMQHAFTESFRAGVALGQMFGKFTSDDGQLRTDQTSTMPAFTAQYVTQLDNSSSIGISGHVAYGQVTNEAKTYQTGTSGKAEWDDNVVNVGVRATWNKQVTSTTCVSLFTGLSYQNVQQASFRETFTDGVRDYRDGKMSSLSIPLGVTIRGIYQMPGQCVFAPELTMAYVGDIARDNPEVKTSVYGFNREGKGTDIGRSAFMLQVGANWLFDSTWSVGAFYALEARENQTNQSVNAAVRMSF